jgi:DNA-binding transcriptional regulator YhcF (GntR family)
MKNTTTTDPNMTSNKASHGPIYGQVRDQIERLIRAGKLASGEQLPSPASLALDLSVDRGEILRAYFELERGELLTKETTHDFLGKPRTTYRVV